jgi:hypothetical protein
MIASTSFPHRIDMTATSHQDSVNILYTLIHIFSTSHEHNIFILSMRFWLEEKLSMNRLYQWWFFGLNEGLFLLEAYWLSIFVTATGCDHFCRGAVTKFCSGFTSVILYLWTFSEF